MENKIIEIAQHYACLEHELVNQTYGKEKHPYSFHLHEVVSLAKKFIKLIPEEHRANVIAAGWCHYLIEDARCTYNDVMANTNYQVAELVYALTNEKGKTRKERANDKYYQGIRETPHAVL